MLQLQLDHVGAPTEALKLVKEETPAPGPREVLVEMEAATVNSSDFMYVGGRYFVPAKVGAAVGAEGVGRVVEVGPDVDEALLGRRVVVLPTYRHGTWATHLCASVDDVIAVPDGIPVDQLAMVGINPPTALRLVRDYGTPDLEGRWIGQTGGNSAVSQYVNRLASHFGYRTLNIVRRESVVPEVFAEGGHRVVVDGPGIADDIALALDGEPLDLAIDCIGGSASAALAHQLRFGATLVSYGALSGQPPTVGIADLIGKQINLTGFWLGHWMQRASLDEVRQTYSELIDLIAGGTISARVQAHFDLSDWRDAVELASSQGRSGKVILSFQEAIRAA